MSSITPEILTDGQKTQLKAFNTFLAKAGGKDKLCATVQYLCLFYSAGEAGNVKKVQGSFAAARKVFRIFAPLEMLTPVLMNEKSNAPPELQALAKLKAVLMTAYMALDHVGWAQQVGIYTDKDMAAKANKYSMYCWLGGSALAAVNELAEIGRVYSEASRAPTAAARAEAENAAAESTRKRLLPLFNACTQTLLAAGLAGIVELPPRTLGALGTTSSLITCYQLYPALAPPAKPALKAA